uniref:BZIP domain-containing protein n=1 Tax=Kalanchoe fedtschenkoi TaxID=63787 RepID=A0A7N0T926_KALFE
MGAGEESTAAKTPKAASSTQETPTTPSYPDWSNMQAYYGASGAPPPFFASTVASPPPHPYMWAGQPMMSPYGAYPGLYPPGGVYAHHTMPMTPGTTQPNVDLEVKASDGKDRASSKKSKGNSGTSGNGGKVGESGKVVSDSGNNGASQSADSGSEASTDASDENTDHQGLSANKKGSFNQMLADANAHNSTVQGKPVSAPATNLNIGMDLWSTTPAGVGAAKLRPNPAVISTAIVPVIAGSRDGGLTDSQWVQDERELKRQKRKQSNRESARRSRLRKQAECEELQGKVEKLNSENRDLKEELQRLSEECVRLSTENASIKEELTRLCGPEAVANLENNNSTPSNP